MIATCLVLLFKANIAAAATIAATLLARCAVRHWLGAGAAYLLWAIVPAGVITSLAPARAVVLADLTRSPTTVWEANLSQPLSAALLSIWAIGALAMAASLLRRQRLFLQDADAGAAGPAVVGFFQPRIVTPDDFAQRFSPLEQRLILAHEQVHLDRQDARINAAAALAQCLCWFNPLAHVAVRKMRADQEAACDAAVVEHRPRARRAYAETLLRTQLAGRSLPLGCMWPADGSHPLLQRIALLARRPLSVRRRRFAVIFVLALIGGGSLAAWGLQPAREIPAGPAQVSAALARDAVLVPFRPLDAKLRTGLEETVVFITPGPSPPPSP